MEYIVKLHSGKTNEITFTTENEAFLHIGRTITESPLPIEIAVERKYLVKHGLEILTKIVYHIYECDCQCDEDLEEVRE